MKLNLHSLTLVTALAAVFAADLDAQRGGRRFGSRRPGGQTAAPAPAEAKQEDKPVEKWTAIQGGDVWIGDGRILRRATVLIGDDKIHGVGHDIELPEGTVTVDATGKVVSPGFCIVKASGFGTSRGSSVKDNLNPYDPSMKMGLAAGITSFLWRSGNGGDTPSGKSAIVKLAFGDLDGMVSTQDTVVQMRVPLDPGKWRSFRKLAKQAHEHVDKLGAVKAGQQPPKAPNGTQELIAIIQGKKTLWISAGGGGGGGFRTRGGGGRRGFTVETIRQGLEVAELLGRGVVLDGPTEAWVIPEEVAATDSMAIINPREKTAPDQGRPDTTGSNIAMAGVLADAGVAVAVTAPSGRFGGATVGTGGILGQDLNTPHVDAAFAIRGGYPNRQGIRLLTLDAARTMGAADRIGSLAEGKDADVLILDGDPLHYRTFVETAFVNGKVVYEKDKEPFYGHIKR